MSTPTQVIATHFKLKRDAFGKLVLTSSLGERFEGVVPVRAFPIQAPEDGISLVNLDGEEVGWVDGLGDLPEPEQGLIREALAARRKSLSACCASQPDAILPVIPSSTCPSIH